MKLYRTAEGVIADSQGRLLSLEGLAWDELFTKGDAHALVSEAIQGARKIEESGPVLAPIVSQEVWAAGVTYFRSRSARIEESRDAGGGTFYDRVYSAERPELFFKGAGWRVVGPGGAVKIRSDARWSVPEPELTLAINAEGKIIGYTIGNDMSSRDIEGENPLYLPQAKVYEGSCALGPALLLLAEPIDRSTKIEIEIRRAEETVFAGSTTLNELKREPTQLVEYLFRDNSFPKGVFLMTGTGIVPEDDFTLASGDVIRIQIEGIGTLQNYVD